MIRKRAVFGLAAGILFSASGADARDEFPFKIGLNTQVVSAGFELEPQPPGSKGDKLTYRPAQSKYAGLILGYRWLGGTVSFSIPADAKTRDLEGTSKYRDYRLSWYDRHFGIEASYNRYQGYLIENSSTLSAATLGGSSFYKVQDLESLGYGATVFFLPDPKNYSLPAALDQSEFQSKSGGSQLWIFTARFLNFTSTGPWIPAEKRPNFGADQNLSSLKASNFAGGWGYAYSWVPNTFFLSGMGALSVGYQRTLYGVDGVEKIKSAGTANIHLRINTGFNARRYFVTGAFYVDRFGQNTETIQVGSNVMGVVLAIGGRF